MVVGGVPERCSRHAAEVASLALHVLDAVPKIPMRHSNVPAARLQIRIGKHLICTSNKLANFFRFSWEFTILYVQRFILANLSPPFSRFDGNAWGIKMWKFGFLCRYITDNFLGVVVSHEIGGLSSNPSSHDHIAKLMFFHDQVLDMFFESHPRVYRRSIFNECIL